MRGSRTKDVAFLFSDIEGSTRLWEQHPDEMRSALERHDSIIKVMVEDAGGEVVKSTGDGVMAAFDQPASAVNAAIGMQRSFADETWETPTAIKVRIGLHSGETQVRGDDYFGPAVNRAARLMAAGHGGQTLVSASIAGALGPGAQLRDLGQHRLKDLSEPERIFEVSVPGLAGQFPPLVTLDITPNNLPTQTSSFLGREHELGNIRTLIDRDGARLVTLVGPGGTGKTRLALQAAAEQVDRFPQGVFFIDLSTETDVDESLANVARVVGIDSTADESALQAMQRGMADRTALLLMDNLEQIEAIGLSINQLLQACPGVGVLATTREPLRVRGEHLYPISPLSLPTKGPVSVDAVADSEAAQLFAERAAQQVHDFAIQESNASLIASICVGLDGLPLALELAAARLRMFSLQELDERLGKQLDVLKSRAHDLPERQRTLNDTIEWSYNLLTDAERDLLQLLSVFAGTTMPDAEEVADVTESNIDVLDDLASLVDKSLVRKTESAVGTSRFSLLVTIRQFATEHSQVNAKRHESWRKAHASHFADMGTQMAEGLAGSDRPRARQQLGVELENLQIAWGHWVEKRDLERLHQLFDPMWMLFDAEGWYQGAIQLAEDLLDVLLEQPESVERTQEQIALETSLARARMLIRGFSAEGERAFMDAVDHAEATGATPEVFPVLRSLASFYTLRGDMSQAREVGEQLLTIADEEGDPTLEVDANLVYGVNTAFTNDLDEGLPYIDKAIDAFDPSNVRSERFRLGPHSGIVSMTTSAFFLAMQGFPVQAMARAGEALAKADELEHTYSKAYALHHVAYFKLIAGDLEGVAAHAGELLALANQYDYQIWRALAMVMLGAVAAFSGDPEHGQAQIEQGIELYQRLPTPPVFWPFLLQLRAPVAAMTGDLDKALEMIDEAVALTSDPASGAVVEMLITRGDLLLMADRPEDAMTCLRDASDAAGEYKIPTAGLRALTRLARLGDTDARARLADIYETFTEGLDLPDLVAAREALGEDG